jgi:hypothetical protein
MNKENENKFTDDLISCLDEAHLKLIDKSVPVQLLIQEIKLIEWALEAYETEAIRTKLVETCSDMSGYGIADGTRQELHSEIDAAFDRAEGCRRLIKRLRFKLSEAVDIALQKIESEPDLS